MRSSTKTDVEIDPNLLELIEEGSTGEVEAIIRLIGPPPPGVVLVSRFGEINTCRLRASDIHAVHDHASVRSLKAPRVVKADVADESAAGDVKPDDRRRPKGLKENGKGVVVGIIDWGPDPWHPDFIGPLGRSRLEAIWDQRGQFPDSPRPWGYGRVWSRPVIDRALSHPRSASGLGGLPGGASMGTHGTHVMSIAAGNGRGGGPMGIAPEADLIFVHLAKGRSDGVGDLGDSVRILEALDFILRLAGNRPVVVNASMGAHGGCHVGESPVELAFDAALETHPGRAIVQSTGNYFAARTHAHETVRPGEKWTLGWYVFAGDATPNELEIWYPGSDLLAVNLVAPDGSRLARVSLGEGAPIRVDGREVGRIYHRKSDPNNGDHLVDCFLDPGAPAGRWRVEVEAIDIVDGRVMAWIERDSPRRLAQSVFDQHQASPFGTTGTIANGRRAIAVGAFDPHKTDAPMAPFSSAGPTRDGRQKPDLVAPGVGSLAARSGGSGEMGLTRKSGTSMAAPVVTGTIACMFEAAGRPLSIAETRSLLLGTALVSHHDEAVRVGSGRLDSHAAVEAARLSRSWQLRSVSPPT